MDKKKEILFDAEIIQASNQLLAAAEMDLKLLIYSISPLSNRSPLNFRQFWLNLISTITRVENTQVILSGWPKNNPQHTNQVRAMQQLQTAGARVRMGHPNLIIHPKCLLFDNKTLIIGSHNATEAGFTRTKNISTIVQDSAQIALFNDYFQKIWDSIGE